MAFYSDKLGPSSLYVCRQIDKQCVVFHSLGTRGWRKIEKLPVENCWLSSHSDIFKKPVSDDSGLEKATSEAKKLKTAFGRWLLAELHYLLASVKEKEVMLALQLFLN